MPASRSEREREVHWQLLRGFGIAPKMPASIAAKTAAPVPEAADDGVEFF